MAPSPTGFLHVGTARTALFNFLFARHHGGTFIVRIEDTDKVRSKPEYETDLIDGLSWLNITWDAFYRQSERTDIYRGYLERAIENGSAYLSKEESKREEGVQIEVVRLKNPNTTITFDDLIRGEISFDTTELGDFVIARSIDEPLYHFTVVVDDHEMEVTHVIRGEDHISNTPRHILIQQAIGAERPLYAHLPLILGKDRSKLSKRHNVVQLSSYREQGYTPEAMNNYLAFLGWNPGTDKEVFLLDELVQIFDIAGIQKGGAIFDIEKLKWFNKEHLRSLDDESFYQIILERLPNETTQLPQFSEQRLARLVPTIRERISVACEITEEATKGEYDFAFSAPKIDPKIIMWKNDTSPRQTLTRLQKLAEIIATIPEDASFDEIRARIWAYAEEVGKGEVLWPLRVALTGRERSPDPFTVMYIVGSGEAYSRVKTACDTILST